MRLEPLSGQSMSTVSVSLRIRRQLLDGLIESVRLIFSPNCRMAVLTSMVSSFPNDVDDVTLPICSAADVPNMTGLRR